MLKKPEHFQKYLGVEVEVRLYRAREGRKEIVGLLSGYENGDVTLDVDGAPVKLEKKDVAQVRLYVRI